LSTESLINGNINLILALANVELIICL
ncbi:unnamed protein product, partial [Rotaria sp. Silwood1]